MENEGPMRGVHPPHSMQRDRFLLVDPNPGCLCDYWILNYLQICIVWAPTWLGLTFHIHDPMWLILVCWDSELPMSLWLYDPGQILPAWPRKWTESWFWEPPSLSLLLVCRCWKLSALESYELYPLTYVIFLVDTSQLTAYMGLWVLLLAWAPMTPLRWPTTVSVSALLSWERSFRFPFLLSSHTYNSVRPVPPYLNLPDCRSA